MFNYCNTPKYNLKAFCGKTPPKVCIVSVFGIPPGDALAAKAVLGAKKKWCAWREGGLTLIRLAAEVRIYTGATTVLPPLLI